MEIAAAVITPPKAKDPVSPINTLAGFLFQIRKPIHAPVVRFKRLCARDGVMSEIRKREHYEKPSVKRKKKSEAARKKAKKY